MAAALPLSSPQPVAGGHGRSATTVPLLRRSPLVSSTGRCGPWPPRLLPLLSSGLCRSPRSSRRCSTPSTPWSSSVAAARKIDGWCFSNCWRRERRYGVDSNPGDMQGVGGVPETLHTLGASALAMAVRARSRGTPSLTPIKSRGAIGLRLNTLRRGTEPWSNLAHGSQNHREDEVIMIVDK
ncbi:hypothetical protein U9M48_009349 [Paspalum notatum var. saurae]|uniref:Uncharacterized protein n=1 Tax=Paspalum notatum var. saurae TaxID=547442 RepID=A0AAQ3WEV8_PASNO